MASLDYAYRRLVNTLGPERVASSEFERMVYSHDFASLPKIALLQWKLYPDFVALPQTTEEVAALVKLSDESLLQITPRGGGTGWYGGSVPNRGGVLIDMRKMNHIVKFDPDGRTVTVEAGATWKDLEDFVESKGFALPIVPVNAIGSTLGGAINSGSTGFGAPRGGSLRDAIARLQVVLPDGSLLKTASETDADGHLANLTPLFFGAEGTLGIITEATIRLVPKPESSKAIAYAFPSLAASARFLKEIVDSALVPSHPRESVARGCRSSRGDPGQAQTERRGPGVPRRQHDRGARAVRADGRHASVWRHRARVREAHGRRGVQDGRALDGARPVPRVQFAEDARSRDVVHLSRQSRVRPPEENQRRQDARGLDEVSVAWAPCDPAARDGGGPGDRCHPAASEADPRSLCPRVRTRQGGIAWASSGTGITLTRPSRFRRCRK